MTCINQKITVLLQPFNKEGVKEIMSNKIQTEKNIDLTQKLIEYLVKGKDVPELPQDVSFVPFSKTDKELNKANEELLVNLSDKDQPLVRAEEPESKNQPWKIIPVNF